MSQVLDSADARTHDALCRVLARQEYESLAANVAYWHGQRRQLAISARHERLHTPHRKFLRRELRWARKQQQQAIERLAIADSERRAN